MLGFEELTSGENIPWSQAAQHEDVEGQVHKAGSSEKQSHQGREAQSGRPRRGNAEA
jgi:hypothetical protein